MPITFVKQILIQKYLTLLFLANWPDDKHIIYNVNNDIPVKITSYPYVLVNRSVLWRYVWQCRMVLRVV